MCVCVCVRVCVCVCVCLSLLVCLLYCVYVCACHVCRCMSILVCALYTCVYVYVHMCLQGAGNRHSDFRAVSRTAYSNVDGVATIRDDTVVYSTVTSGGTNVVYDGIVSSPMYAVLEPEETAYEMYQYVPSKVGCP